MRGNVFWPVILLAAVLTAPAPAPLRGEPPTPGEPANLLAGDVLKKPASPDILSAAHGWQVIIFKHGMWTSGGIYYDQKDAINRVNYFHRTNHPEAYYIRYVR